MSQQTKKPSLRETFEILGKSFRVSLGVKSKPSLLVSVLGFGAAFLPAVISKTLQSFTDSVAQVFGKGTQQLPGVFGLFAVLSGLYILQLGYNTLRDYFVSVDAERVRRYIKEKILRHTCTVRYKYLENEDDFREKVLFASDDTGYRVAESMNKAINWVQYLLTFLSIVVILSAVNVWITVALIVTCIPAVILAYLQNDEEYRNKAKWMQENAMVSQYYTETNSPPVQNDVRFFGMLPHMKRVWSELKDVYINKKNKMTRKHVLFNSIADILRNSVYIVILLLTAKQIFDTPEVGLGVFMLVFTTASQFQEATARLLIGGIQFVSDLPYMRDFFDLDDLEHEEIDVHAAPYPEYGIEFKNVSFAYPNTDRTVLKDINVTIKPGEKVAIVGENGSGKTTLMNMISGIYFPDEGHIFVEGKEVTIRSPKDAYALGIGMIHQHFKLVDVFTAAENIVLGLEGKGRFDIRSAGRRVKEISEKYGFDIDPDKKVYDMSVSEKQTVEIIKVLYRGADILILDEPTAVLTPQETEKLFAVLRNMRADGKAIVIITHKLHEVMALSDQVAVLRKGRYIGTVNTAETNPQALTEMMVGRAVSLNIDRPEAKYKDLRLEVKGLTCRDHEGVKTLDDVSFQAFGGEILGIAGIAGSGQKELLEAIAGLQHVEAGSVLYYPPHPNSDIAGYHVPVDRNGEELVGKNPTQIRKVGVSLAFVPEDRLGMGLVAGMDMVDNMMLKTYREHKGPFVDRKAPRALAERLIEELEIVTPGVSTPVRRLSGGNVQKVLVGREIDSTPTVLMTAYPVRGLDINSSYTIYGLLNQQKLKGVAVILVGEDLDVLLELCDRILVLCGGKVSGIVDGRGATKEEVGLYMTHVGGGKEAAQDA